MRNALLVAVLPLVLHLAGCSAEPSLSPQTALESPQATVGAAPTDSFVPLNSFFVLLSGLPHLTPINLAQIEDAWHPGHGAMLLEIDRFVDESETRNQIEATLQRKLGNLSSSDRREMWQAVWRQSYDPHPQYAEFKAALYSGIDERFVEYFRSPENATIRLDEIVWGGVIRDGIPPLKNPKMLSADEATYLDDSDVVFGIVVGDDARAYPKRILAWHEMVKDVVGGLSLNGVYCTLCGSMIAYKTESQGKHYELGTSGFLYRSNKLMYDHETKSLWSTLDGQPCVGPLVGQKIVLEPYHVVTTNWGEWRRRHPQTKVLSLKTGHNRDYGEGVAYRKYFATDELMFDVPGRDYRLKNKDEVLIVRLDTAQPLAISAIFLKEHPLYHDSLDAHRFVVVTDVSGANRVYSAGDHTFVSQLEDTVIDQSGVSWSLSEQALINGSTGATLNRLPAHRAFWFGWFAAHPETRLIP